MHKRSGSRRLFFLFTLALLILGTGSATSAQTVGGTLRGTVTDATGGVVPGATVTAQNEATGAKFSTFTSSAGL